MEYIYNNMCKKFCNEDTNDSDNLYSMNGLIENLSVTNLTCSNPDLSSMVTSGVGALNENYIIVGQSSDLHVKNSFLKTANNQVEGFASSTYVSGGNFGDTTIYGNTVEINAFIRKDGSLDRQTGGITNVIQNGTGEYRIEFDNVSGVNPWISGTAFNDNGYYYLIQVLKINPNDVTINTANVKSFAPDDSNFFIRIVLPLL